MGEVIKIGGYTKLPIKPNNVLEGAIDKLDFVFIAGRDNEGNEYFASSCGKAESIDEVLWLIERFKFKLMSGDFK